MDFQLPYAIYNRDVGGFTADELRAALEECIFALEPAYLFINIGTNDFNKPDYNETLLLERYEDIITRIKQSLTETKLYLLAYYPVNPESADNFYTVEILRHRTNERIRSASEGVRRLAEKHNAVFLDLNTGITDE